MSSLHGATKQSEVRPTPLVMVLLGKTGRGKSSTANTILQIKDFEKGSNATSCSMIVKDGPVKSIEGQTIQICDTPGAFENLAGEETDQHIFTNEEKMCKLMDNIMLRLFRDSGVHAFVLVYSVSDPRFTEEDVATIAIYKRIFGGDFISKYGIIAFTHGDNFDKDEHGDFPSWCAKQHGSLKTLMEECDNRVVLMYNNFKGTEYLMEYNQSCREIIRIAVNLKERRGVPAYRKIDYEKFNDSRIKLILESKNLKDKFIMEIQTLATEVNTFKQKVTEQGRQLLLVKIGRLTGRIEELSQGTDFFEKQLKEIRNYEEIVIKTKSNCKIF